MIDSADSSISFSAADFSGQSEPDLVAFADCEIISINNAMTLVINRQSGNQQIMSRDVVEGLKTCTSFKAVEAHAAHLAKTRAELQGQEGMAVAALNNLKSAGMLLQAGDVCARLNQTAPREKHSTRVFVITCDRPAAVERLLDSMLKAGKLSQHDALFLVDDSRESANRKANREAVSLFNRSSAKEMFYVGTEAQQLFLAGMIDELPQYSAGIRFLLDPAKWQGSATYGRSRTLCLLLSVGFRALVMDDDILCQAILPRVKQEGVGIGSGALRQADFFASEQALFGSGKAADFNPLSGHASLLGSDLGSALQELNAGPLREDQLLDCNAALANVLTASSPVLVTQSGALGDPGAGSAHWALVQDEATMERLVSAPQGMQAAIEERLNWVGSTRPNIYKMPFMSQLTGLDNSQLLPPYFPAFRGKDALFGAMLLVIQPQSVTIEYPWSVPHLPLEKRTYSVQDSMALAGDMTIFSRYLTELDYRDTPGPEQALKRLAQDILRLADRSDHDLRLDFRRELAKGQAGYLRVLQEKLSRIEKFNSVELQEYFSRGIGELQESIAAKSSPTAMKGIPVDSTEAQIFTQFRSMAQEFAVALDGWAEIRVTAAALSESLIDSQSMLPR